MIRHPPSSPLFPSTTLFRSHRGIAQRRDGRLRRRCTGSQRLRPGRQDRKSTRLNSSHIQISYSFSFFFNDPAPPEFSPLPLHDALPISPGYCSTTRWTTSPPMYREPTPTAWPARSEEHTSELQSHSNLIFLLFFF